MIQNSEQSVSIMNCYDNTEELLQKFPVEHQTNVAPGIGEKIQNRLLTGFENWNRGFDAWKAWGDILYTPDSIYNVHGARLTLSEYQSAMNVTLKKVNIQMGAFHDMIICDDWCAIRYDITTIAGDRKIPGSVMEFVNFKDYGDPLGTRVVEGWGAPKDSGYSGMAMFRGDQSVRLEEKETEKVLNYRIPEEDDLRKKYPVMHPTTDHSMFTEPAREAILRNFDAWNKGYESWSTWADRYFSEDIECCDNHDQVLTSAEYRESVKTQIEKENMKRLYFDSMLLSGEWAAIHYRTVYKDPATGKTEAGERMQFLRFREENGDVKLTACWTK